MGTGRVEQQIFMVGTGGQGILLLARALSELASRSGQKVISSETHGMAMRGGTVTASLKIGDFESPLIPVGCADILIGLDETEASQYLSMLTEGGISIVNTPSAMGFDHTIDATGKALELGAPGSVNMIMLGLTLKVMGYSLGEAHGIVSEISPERALKTNLLCIDYGFGRAPTNTDT
ncbi:MAG: 2-oxoacid:acceptor oxidoreductase family protein [Desulfomonilia bacterium]